MQMINESKHHLRINQLGNLKVPPGATIEVADHLVALRRSVAGEPMTSVLALVAPQLVPADESDRAEYAQAGGFSTLMSEAGAPAVTAAMLQAQGLAPGVAALVADGDADDAPKPPARTGHGAGNQQGRRS